MKILIIGTTDILGGAAKVSWTLKEYMEKSGYTVSMFVADKRSDDPSVSIIPRRIWQKYLGLLFATDNFISTDWILNTKEFKEADIVHCHNLHGRFFNLKTLQKMSLIKPVVWTLHDEWALTPHCAYTLEGSELENGLYKCPSIDTQPRILWDNTKRLSHERNDLYKKSKLNIVTPSLWLKERAEKTILKEQNIVLIPNGIDTSSFTKKDKNEARKMLNLPLDKKIILFLANDAKNNTWKGWKYTEEIISKNVADKNILFLSVGNLSDHKNEDNVLYIGNITKKEELSLYYSAADVLLFTSIAENFPLVILEAMSCGLPIVSFDVGGVKEVVTHKENGYIAGYKDVDEVQNGLNWIMSLSKQDRENMSKKSADKIKTKYDVSIMNKNYQDLYNGLI